MSAIDDHLDEYRGKMDSAHRAYELAGVYVRDGALASGARELDKAADLLREAQAMRNKALTGGDDPAVEPIIRIPASLLPKLTEFFGRTLGKMFADASFDAQATLNREECVRAIQKLQEQQETGS